MEETKTSKINSVIAKFKALKRPYQIAIAVGIVAVIVLIVLLSSPKTPFDKLKDYPDIDTVRAQFGEEEQIVSYEGAGRNKIMYYPSYDWLGYKGTLKIYIRSAGNSWRVDWAEWVFQDGDTDAAYSKLYRAMNRNFGKGKKDGPYYTYWYDKMGHEYALAQLSADSMWVSMR